MNKMRKVLALVLALLVALSAVGCNSSARMEELVGVWECLEFFTPEEITELLEANDFYAEEIAVVSVDSLYFVKVLELKEDKTYRFAYDGDACKELVRGFFTEVIADLYANRDQLTGLYGEELTELTQADFEQGYAELYGCANYTELINMFAENCYDYDALSEDMETGTFRFTGNKLYTTVAGQVEEEYLDYTLQEGVLTLTYIDAVEEYTKAN